MEYLYSDESKILFKLACQLHTELGCGFKEKVYQDAFEVLLKENGIPYEREHHMNIVYHGTRLAHDFFWDFLCFGKIGVELKALAETTGEAESQVINYLHVGKQQLGVLFNFGASSLQYKWFANRPDYVKNKL